MKLSQNDSYRWRNDRLFESVAWEQSSSEASVPAVRLKARAPRIPARPALREAEQARVERS
jgi:hypothetical protein